MRQLFWYLILAASIFVSVMGYQNANNWRETQGEGRNAVCKAMGQAVEACELPGNAEPSGHSAGVTHRTYQFVVKGGVSWLAECKREYMFAGHWACTAKQGSLM
jgi:hypothetical protein